MMKDFATKKNRVEGLNEKTPGMNSHQSTQIGRWILLAIIVFSMVGYAIWSHRHSFFDWVSSKSHPKSIATTEAASSVKPSSVTPSAPAPTVQFDFYHELTHGSGEKNLAQEQLIKTNKISTGSAVPSPSPSSGAASVVSSSSSTVATEEKSTAPIKEISEDMKPIPEDAVRAVSAMKPIPDDSPKSLPPIKSTQESSPAKVMTLKSNAPVKALTPVKMSKPAPVSASSKTSPSKVIKIERYVVEAGNFTDKNKAQALRAKLLMLGFSPQISTQSGHYHVHFGLMKNMTDAQTLRRQLAKANMPASILTIVSTGDSHGG
jgi:cell division protein FtsN